MRSMRERQLATIQRLTEELCTITGGFIYGDTSVDGDPLKDVTTKLLTRKSDARHIYGISAVAIRRAQENGWRAGAETIMQRYGLGEPQRRP